MGGGGRGSAGRDVHGRGMFQFGVSSGGRTLRGREVCVRLRSRLKELIHRIRTFDIVEEYLSFDVKPYEPRTCSRCGLVYDVRFTPLPSEAMPKMPAPTNELCSVCVRELDADAEEDIERTRRIDEEYERANVVHVDLLVAEQDEADPHSLHVLMRAAARVACARGWSFDKFQEETGAYFLSMEDPDPPEAST